jgi:UDP-N-acetylmuramyl pentapeptide phosphotransferase/UDP-N-acetylglucosamine-1-phosphate transferase
MQTLQHIPVWVFALLIGLIALGLVQTRTRHIHKQRLLGINIALTVFTLVGVVQQWRPTPWLGLGLLSWAAAGLLVTWALGQGAVPAGASYDPETRRFTVPGSWLPLALFMTIFACKFAVGMTTAMAPDLLDSLSAAIGVSALYGLLSGVLNARALKLLQLPKHPSHPQKDFL